MLQGKSRSQKPAQKFQDDFDSGSEASSSDSDNALEDYLSNLQCDSDNSNSYERQVLLATVLQRLLSCQSGTLPFLESCLLQQELHLLEQFTAARVGHQAAVECMQEAAQGEHLRQLKRISFGCCYSQLAASLEPAGLLTMQLD